MTLALGLAVLSAAGCASVRNARDAQDGTSILDGERIASFAESGIDTSAPVSVAQLESAALRFSPALLQARQGVILAQLGVKDVDSALIPTLDANAGYTLQTSNYAPATETDWSLDDSINVGASLNWLLYDFGRTRAAAREAVQDLAAAEYGLAAAEDGVVYGVRRASFALLRAIELYGVALESESAYADHLQQMRDRFDVGAVNSYAVTKAAVDASNARLASVTSSNAVLTCRANLDLALGIAESPVFELVASEMPDFSGRGVDDLMAVARTTAPALAAARANAEGARHAIDKTIADLYPSLGLSIQLTGSGSDDFLWNLIGAGNVAQSVFAAGRNRRAIDRAVANFRIARSKAVQAELELYNALSVAVLDGERARQQLEVALESERMAQENYDIVNERYEVGKASELERTDAQVALSSAKAATVSARYDSLDAQIAIAKLIGL